MNVPQRTLQVNAFPAIDRFDRNRNAHLRRDLDQQAASHNARLRLARSEAEAASIECVSCTEMPAMRPATKALLSNPYGVFVDAAGTLYIAGTGNNVIRKVDTRGIIWVVAGNNSNCLHGSRAMAARPLLLAVCTRRAPPSTPGATFTFAISPTIASARLRPHRIGQRVTIG